IALIFVSYLVGRFTSFLVVTVWKFFAKRAATHIDEDLIGAVRTPFRILFGIAVFRIAVDSLALTLVLQSLLDHATFSLLVIGLSLLFLRMLNVAMGWAIGHLPIEAQYEFRRRELRTRFGLLLRVADIIVIILATAAILTQFSFVRTVGLSVLASAGIAGVVVGLAAQKSVSSVIAGIQISLTQPIRIGDVVKVEGQTGTVEEVSLTNVVLRIADQRRLIVPVSRFLDQPFENWTRRNTEILGTLTLVVDFATPIDELRAEAKKIVEASALWDKRKFALTVTDVSQAGVQVSVLVSACDSTHLADLKNEAREALLKFLQQKEGGAYFITTRTAAPGASGAPVKEPDATVTK
ncbi:MAG: mechanosensitive ion channel domain-containing protein, partial [Polyangiaceae bacterium]